MRWMPEEDDRLRELIVLHSNSEVAVLMGRSEKSVIARLNILGITRNKGKSGAIATCFTVSPTMKAALQADADKRGMTIGTIIREIVAAHYGLNEPTRALTGGPRPGAGRRPRAKVVSNQFVPPKIGKPSMPAIPMRST